MSIIKKGGRGGRRAGAGRPPGDSRLYTFRAPGEMAEVIDRQENKTDFIRNCITRAMRSETAGKVVGRSGVAVDAGAEGAVQAYAVSKVRGRSGMDVNAGAEGAVQAYAVSKVRGRSGVAVDAGAEGAVQAYAVSKVRGRSGMDVNAGAEGAAALQTNVSSGLTANPARSSGRVIPATAVRGSLRLPFFDLGIRAGFPIPLDNDEKAQDIELLRMLCPHPEASYLIRVAGNSMIDAGINDGDIIIVDKSHRNPAPSEVAVCELNGEYTLKRFEKDGDGCGWLVPANPDYPRIRITEDDSFSVWGTVSYIIHKPRL